MSRYYGTEAQQWRQRKSDRLTPWIIRTPGACLTGRYMGTDDPARLGWDVIHEHLQEDGAFSFRWIDKAGYEEITLQVNGISTSIFTFEGFCSFAGILRPTIANMLKQAPGDGLSVEIARGEALREAQVFLSDHGIIPLSTAALGGEICKARTVLIRRDNTKPVAAGFVGMMQNEHSPLHDCAWVGLIACDAHERGRGLGRRITCELIRVALDDLGARRVMGFAAPDNLASKAMLAGSGLQPVDRASYVVMLSEARFTR